MRLGRQTVFLVVQIKPTVVECRESTTPVLPPRQSRSPIRYNNTLEPLIKVPNTRVGKLCNFRNETRTCLRDLRQHFNVEEPPSTTRQIRGLLKLSHPHSGCGNHDDVHIYANALQRRAKVRVLTPLIFWLYSILPKSRLNSCHFVLPLNPCLPISRHQSLLAVFTHLLIALHTIGLQHKAETTLRCISDQILRRHKPLVLETSLRRPSGLSAMVFLPLRGDKKRTRTPT